MNQKPNITLVILMAFFLLTLTYAGFLAYKSIQFDVLDKLESTPLQLPPAPTNTIPLETSIPQTPPPHSSTN